MITISVLYPKTPTSRFDHDYYLRQHIPLVKSLWTSMGLVDVELFRGVGTLEGNQPAYELLGLLHFDSEDSVAGALQAHGAEVMADIPNFTDVQPFIQSNVSAAD